MFRDAPVVGLWSPYRLFRALTPPPELSNNATRTESATPSYVTLEIVSVEELEVTKTKRASPVPTVNASVIVVAPLTTLLTLVP